MSWIKKIWNFILFDTYGNIALASFVICAISGVALAIPYSVSEAYDSISLMLITNMPAVLFRNMHYWSAQFFLVFTILHSWEHIKLRTSANLGAGVWLRLVISILVILFVMLSGFILKADADSLQAKRILETLTKEIPIAGNFISNIIFSNNADLLLIYVHHIATATIILIFVIYEHAQILWTKRSTFLVTLAVITLLGFFLHAPLHDNINPVLKGPWYFVGLQEILHWMSNPGMIWIVVLVFLTFLFVLKYFGDNSSKASKIIIGILAVFYLGLTIIGFYFRGENWKWELPWNNQNIQSAVTLESGFQKVNEKFKDISASDIPVVNNKREACMLCHENLSGFSDSHDPQAIGCTSCHFGNPFTLNKNDAHDNMVLIPGNLSNADLSCGTINCHPEITSRISSSLMTTNSGIVSVDRFVFGEAQSPDIKAHIKEIGHSAADKHLRDLCAKCHLGNDKQETGPIDQMSRGGGCTACHLNYSPQGHEQHLKYIANNSNEEYLPSVHPSLDLIITNDHCFGCHSRSGRISTNYEGWHETLLEENEILGKEGYRVLQDKRVFEYVAADVHHELGIECIDCHNSYEVMGDGNLYAHEEQAVKIRCEDCHFQNQPETIGYSNLDAESRKIFDIRNFSFKDKQMVKNAESGIALINVFMDGDSAFMISKNSEKKYLLSRPGVQCTKEHVHNSLSCSSCHTEWAPQCIGCHNAYDRNSEGYDLLDNKFVTGEWIEYVGEFYAQLPTLGVSEGDEKSILPAIPGMILTIDKSGYYASEGSASPDDKVYFHRLYAPAAPHTTSSKGRSCKSCHNDPLAIGYGRGKLDYVINAGIGKWKFEPAFASSEFDGLPEDAWIGFLSVNSPESISIKENIILSDYKSTRSDFRPFTIEEQQRILTIGACLTCHEEKSEIIIRSLDQEFNSYLKIISTDCILPEWK